MKINSQIGLRPGTFVLRLTLDPHAPMKANGVLTVRRRARLYSVHPQTFDLHSLATYHRLFLLGADFLVFKDLPGTLRCSLVQGTQPAIATSLREPALILTDNVVACPVSLTAVRQMHRLTAEPTRILLQLQGVPGSPSSVLLDLPLEVADPHVPSTQLVVERQLVVRASVEKEVSDYTLAERQAPSPPLRKVHLLLTPNALASAQSTMQCEFSTDSQFSSNLELAVGQVLDVTSAVVNASEFTKVACELPLLPPGSQTIFARIKIEQRMSADDQTAFSAAFPSVGFA